MLEDSAGEPTSTCAAPELSLKAKRSGSSCQVVGCEFALPETQYHRRYRICSYHAGVPQMQLGGALVRFCQQCGRFQAVGDFEGSKKSCRKKLDMHNAQRKRKRLGKQSVPATMITRKRSQSTAAARRKQLVSPMANGPPPSEILKNPIPSTTPTGVTYRPSSFTIVNASDESSHDIDNAPPLELNIDVNGIELLEIDALLDRLADDNGPISMQADLSAAYTTAPSMQMAIVPDQSSGRYQPAAAAVAAAAAQYDALALALNSTDQWSFAVPSARASAPRFPSLPVVTTGSTLPTSADANAVNLAALYPVAIPTSPYAVTRTQATIQGGGSSATLAGWAPAHQAQPVPSTSALPSLSDLSRDLDVASFSLFNVPPSELPPEVYSALTESLTTESMQTYLHLAMRLK